MQEQNELKFRKLKADEIECRVGQATQKGITLLLYKTSRTDVDILNEAVGAMNWQVEQKDIAGKLYTGVSIWDNNKKQWVYKWSVGTESNMEAAKGEDSDGLKRSAFRWGLGLELYSAPRIFISADKCDMYERNGKYGTWDKFIVEKISYNTKGEIDGLSILNIGNGIGPKKERVYVYLSPEKEKTKKEKKKQEIINTLKNSES